MSSFLDGNNDLENEEILAHSEQGQLHYHTRQISNFKGLQADQVEVENIAWRAVYYHNLIEP